MIYTCTLKPDIREEVVDGKYVLTELNSIYNIIVGDRTPFIEFKEDFLNENFTKTSFTEFLKTLKELNPNMEFSAPQAYLIENENTNAGIKKFLNFSNYLEAIQYFTKNRDNGLKTLRSVIKSVEGQKEELARSTNKLATANFEIATLLDRIEGLEEQNAMLQESLNIANSRINNFRSLAKIKTQKELDISSFEEIKPIPGRFRKILYFREISRVKYTDTFITYLKELIKVANKESVRVLYIEPENAHSRVFQYRNAKHYNSLTVAEAIEVDILVTGFKRNSIEAIMKNAKEFEVLIILDRSYSDNITIKSDPTVEKFYIASDDRDAMFFTDLPDRIISYSNPNLYIPYIENFERLSEQEYIIKYSEMDITKRILNVLRG